MTASDINIDEINDLRTWLEKQGFKRHPFEHLVADDDDENLEGYFQ